MNTLDVAGNPTTFQQITETLLREDFEQMSVDEFFGVLAAMDEADAETIELRAHIENGRLALDTSAPLPVEGNTIYVGNKRIVITLDEAA